MTRVARLRSLAVRHAQPIRYVLAGGANTLFGLGSYPALLWLFPVFRRWYMAALPIAQVCSILFAFMLYKKLVFRSREPVLPELARFSSVYAGIFAINVVALPLLVEVAHLKPAVAQVAFALFTIVASYLWHSRVTFRARAGR